MFYVINCKTLHHLSDVDFFPETNAPKDGSEVLNTKSEACNKFNYNNILSKIMNF